MGRNRRKQGQGERHVEGMTVQDVNVDHYELSAVMRSGDRRFWPENRPLPQAWVKVRSRQMPCPACRRVLLDNHSQAVVCTQSGTDTAFFRCRACGHRWQLPVTMNNDQ